MACDLGKSSNAECTILPSGNVPHSKERKRRKKIGGEACDINMLQSFSSVMGEGREEKSLADTSWRQKEWVSILAVKLAYWQHGNATFLLSPLIVNQFENFLQYDASWRHLTTSSVQTKFAMGPGEHLSSYRNKKSILAVWQVKPDDETVYHIQSSHVCS